LPALAAEQRKRERRDTHQNLADTRIANIDPNDAMILSHGANPGRIEFRKGHREFLEQNAGFTPLDNRRPNT
jgi:hypothetical protein